MEELLVDLKVCDKSIDHWMDQRLAVAGAKETELVYWYGHRDMVLAAIRERSYWRYGGKVPT